jgi:hypothetical protein
MVVSYYDLCLVEVYDLDPTSASATYVRTIGSPGSGNAQFDEPYRLMFTPSNSFLVADWRNNRVQELQLDGTWVRSLTVSSPVSLALFGDILAVGTYDTIELLSYSTGSVIRTIGSQGSAPGQIYYYAVSLSFTLDGQHIIMADQADRVSMFKVSDGSFVKLIADGVVGWYWNDVLVAPNGELYITDYSSNRVLVYDPTFTTMTRSWSTTDSGPIVLALAGGGSKLIVQFDYAAASTVYV